MSDALKKYRNALKRYRKDHPNVPYAQAQQAVSKQMKDGTISGTRKRKRKVGKAPVSQKKAMGSPRKKRTTRRATVSGTGKTATIGRVERGAELVKKINSLERRRQRLKDAELRDLVQLEINSCHDQLDRIKSSYKRKSA